MKTKGKKWNWKRCIAIFLCVATIMTNASIAEATETLEKTELLEETGEMMDVAEDSEAEEIESEISESEMPESVEVDSESTESEEDAECEELFDEKIYSANNTDLNVSEDYTLLSDTEIAGSLFVNGGELNLNGYTLTVGGNVSITAGTLNVGSGTLNVKGDFDIGKKGEDGGMWLLATSSGALKMHDAKGRVNIDGNFEVCCSTIMNQEDYLSNGQINLKGNFAQYGTHPSGNKMYAQSNNFTPGGNHTLVFCGNEKQSIYFEHDSILYSGIIRFENPNIELLSGLRGFVLYEDLELSLQSENNRLAIGEELDLNGKTLTFNNDIDLTNGTINVGNGTLNVKGNFSIGTKGEDGGMWLLSTSSGALKMHDAKGRVNIDGNFEVCCSTIMNQADYLSDGQINLKGNFAQYGTHPSGNKMYAQSNNFTPGGNHTLVFCGNEKQSIYFEHDSILYSGIIRFENSNIELLSGLRGFVLYEDLELSLQSENNRLAIGEELDLNGKTLTFNNDIDLTNGTINVGNGTLNVKGNFSIGTKGEDGGMWLLSTSSGALKMHDAKGRVNIDGNFEVCCSTIMNQVDYLSDGQINLKGNFAQYGTHPSGNKMYAQSNNFTPGGNHKLVLCGTKPQTIFFESSNSKFNILELKQLKSNYTFEPKNCWQTLICNSFSVFYELDGGVNSKENSDEYMISDKEIVLADAMREGYLFGGWYLDKEFKKPISVIPANNKDDITLYAKWLGVKFVLRYKYIDAMDPNGNAQRVFSENIFENQNAVILPMPKEITGYQFNWYVDKTCKEIITSVDSSSEEDVTVYGKWTDASYYVSFDPNGGTGSMGEQKILYKSAVALRKNAYSKKGYVFTGWNTKADGTGTAYVNAQKVKGLVDKADGRITIYAQWTPVEYKITYKNIDKNTINDNPLSFNCETNVTLRNPGKTGYTFAGWYTDSKCTKPIESIPAEYGKSITIYAKWEANKYTIVFDGNGADNESSVDLGRLSCTYGKAVKLTKNIYVKADYTFDGWNTMADGNGKAYKNLASVKDAGEHDGEEVVLYAQWKVNGYKITYKNIDKNMKNDNPAFYSKEGDVVLVAPERTGYTFAGWYTDAKFTKSIEIISRTGTKAVTVYAKWLANHYTIAFDGNGADNASTVDLGTLSCIYGKATKLVKNVYTKKGYTFAGWNTLSDGTGKAYKNLASVKDAGSEVDEQVTLYAQWKVVEYKITYKNIDKKMINSNPTTFSIEGDVVLTTPERTGYTFGGWYKDSKFKNPIEVIEHTGTKAVTVYAKWIANEYTIVFDGNGADNDDILMSPLVCVYAKAKKLSNNLYIKQGYKFIGWNTMEDGTGKVYKNLASVKDAGKESGEEVILYAQWQVIDYKITYKNIDKKMANNNPSTYNIERDVYLTEPVRVDYVFDGWYTDSKFTNPIEMIDSTTGKNVTVYAKWIKE